LEEKKKRSQLKFARMREGLGRVNVSKTMEPELFHQLSMEETRRKEVVCALWCFTHKTKRSKRMHLFGWW
jgi:hypothetical protein